MNGSKLMREDSSSTDFTWPWESWKHHSEKVIWIQKVQTSAQVKKSKRAVQAEATAGAKAMCLYTLRYNGGYFDVKLCVLGFSNPLTSDHYIFFQAESRALQMNCP